LLGNSCLFGFENKDYDECKEASKKSFDDYENDELNALHNLWILVYHHHPLCNSFNYLEEKQR